MTIDDVRTWKDYRGKKELLIHFSGEPLTPKQAIMAQCYSCTAGYVDGRIDCEPPASTYTLSEKQTLVSRRTILPRL